MALDFSPDVAGIPVANHQWYIDLTNVHCGCEHDYLDCRCQKCDVELLQTSVYFQDIWSKVQCTCMTISSKGCSS